MAIKTTFGLLLVLLFFLSAAVSLEHHKKDPELETCKHQCKQLEHVSKKQQQECEKRCEDYHWEKHEQEEEQGGQGGSNNDSLEKDENPFIFRQENFKYKSKSQEGYFKVLERFSKRSNLLRGIENYRLGIKEMNPNSFSIPKHRDADTVSIVLNGGGIVTLIEENMKQTYNLERGDILRLRAGTTVYFVNKDNKEKLYLAELVQPVSNPGKFEEFFGAGGRDPESFYNAFSKDILEAAFNTPSAKLQKLFKRQKKGAIVKASREQIESLNHHTSSSEHVPWPIPPLGHGSERTFNLFNKRPLHSNEFGKLYQVDQDDYKQLRDLDIAVAFENITGGAMLSPYYNSRATKIAVVVDGKGYIEIATPQQSSSGKQSRHERQEREGQGRQELEGPQGRQEEHGQSRSTSYQKLSARLSRGDVIVVPAGHPAVTVASHDQNLQVICFDINAENNKKYPLAGKNSILKQLEREAKELAFDMPAKQVDEILDNQNESWFLPGPHQRTVLGETI